MYFVVKRLFIDWEKRDLIIFWFDLPWVMWIAIPLCCNYSQLTVSLIDYQVLCIHIYVDLCLKF